jgi:G3E family GTPase
VDCAVPPAVVFDALRPEPSRGQAPGTDTSDALVTTFTLAAAAPVERRRLEDCLARLPEGVLRIKGFLRLDDTQGRPELLQAVARRWRWQQAPEGAAAGRLAVIALAGTVDPARLEAHFASAGLIVAD